MLASKKNSNIKREFGQLVKRDEFCLSILVCIFIAICGFFADLPNKSLSFAEEMPSAAQNAMVFRSGIGQAFLVCLLPLLSCFPYSDSYFMEKQTGYYIPIRAKITKFKYQRDKLFVIFISSFLIVMLPFVINQLICLIAYPLNSGASTFGNSIYENFVWIEKENSLFSNLYFNYPYFNNALHILLIGWYGANLAVLGFSISFFINNRIIILFSTTVIALISYFLMSMLNLRSYVAYLYLFADPSVGGLNIWHFILINAAILLISSIFFITNVKRETV